MAAPPVIVVATGGPAACPGHSPFVDIAAGPLAAVPLGRSLPAHAAEAAATVPLPELH